MTTRWAKYVLAGGLAGLLVGVGILFVLATLYGKSIGLAPVDCAVLGCVLTLLLSQPVGIASMGAGAAIGAAMGIVVHDKRPVSPR